MKVKAFIEIGLDGTYDVTFGVNNPLPFGSLGQGNSVEEAIADFHNSNIEMKDYYKSINKEFPEFTVEFCFDIQSFLKFYATRLSLAGLEIITGVNQRQLSHYMTGHRRPSHRTVQKIEEAIHKFANELLTINLA